MPHTYRAILHSDRIEWIDPPPKCQRPVSVEIKVEEEGGEATTSRGAGMADALRALAERGGLRGIPDPVTWQREVRKDRSLPRRGK